MEQRNGGLPGGRSSSSLLLLALLPAGLPGLQEHLCAWSPSCPRLTVKTQQCAELLPGTWGRGLLPLPISAGSLIEEGAAEQEAPYLQ